MIKMPLKISFFSWIDLEKIWQIQINKKWGKVFEHFGSFFYKSKNQEKTNC